MTNLAGDRIRYLVAGDRGRTADFEFVGVTDLSGVDEDGIVGHVWKTVGDRDAHNVTVEVLDPVTRMCRVHWGTAPTDWLPSQTRTGSWRFEVQASWPDTPAVTAPERYAVTLKVRAQGDVPVEP